jgi:uncharacterized zinc-type alcohol dehydrogenase-like protein
MATSTVQGYAAMGAGQPLEPITYASPILGEHDVLVSITHCGLCYTDIQGISDHYGISTFPFVPGHEIVGSVSELGAEVNDLKEGDRVGIGWQGRSCMRCEWCLKGEEQLCEDIENCGTWKPYGGFSSSIVVDSRFAYHLPDAMASEHAAVLMCAGISVYSPLKKFAPEGAKRVGVIGVGGLGHLAIQFAHAMGCEVTAISSSPAKRDEAIEFGADHFVHGADQSGLQALRRSFDLLLYTSYGKVDWTSLLDCLKTRGRLLLIGFSDVPVTFDPLELVVNEFSITGSLIGNRATMREMLSFANDHDIAPEVELMPMAQVNQAIRRLKENKARYRIVLIREGSDPQP